MKLGILVHPFYMGMGSYKMNKHRLITYLSTIDKYDKVYVWLPQLNGVARRYLFSRHYEMLLNDLLFNRYGKRRWLNEALLSPIFTSPHCEDERKRLIYKIFRLLLKHIKIITKENNYNVKLNKFKIYNFALQCKEYIVNNIPGTLLDFLFVSDFNWHDNYREKLYKQLSKHKKTKMLYLGPIINSCEFGIMELGKLEEDILKVDKIDIFGEYYNQCCSELKKDLHLWNKKLNIRILKKSSILYSKKRSRNKSKNYLGVYNEHDGIYYDNNGKTSKEIKLNHNYMLR